MMMMTPKKITRNIMLEVMMAVIVAEAFATTCGGEDTDKRLWEVRRVRILGILLNHFLI